MIAVEIAMSASTMEIVTTTRSCPSVRGKPSLRRPSANERNSAHRNRRPPPIQNGFIGPELTEPEDRGLQPHARAPAAAAAALRAGRGAEVVDAAGAGAWRRRCRR